MGADRWWCSNAAAADPATIRCAAPWGGVCRGTSVPQAVCSPLNVAPLQAKASPAKKPAKGGVEKKAAKPKKEKKEVRGGGRARAGLALPLNNGRRLAACVCLGGFSFLSTCHAGRVCRGPSGHCPPTSSM